MTTEDDFHAMLDRNPEDHATRLVFADWLQDRGDARAEGYRALGTFRRVPVVIDFSSAGGNKEFHFARGRLNPSDEFFWVNCEYLLPLAWMRAAESLDIDYCSRRDLEDQFSLAFVRMAKSRRKKLLCGVAT